MSSGLLSSFCICLFFCFFFNDTATTEIYTLSLHDALPIWIKTRYETRVGHHVPDSTVYRLLARHQWRQATPRPKHLKNNPAARAAFKKTPGQNGRGGGWTPGPALAPDV